MKCGFECGFETAGENKCGFECGFQNHIKPHASKKCGFENAVFAVLKKHSSFFFFSILIHMHVYNYIIFSCRKLGLARPVNQFTPKYILYEYMPIY